MSTRVKVVSAEAREFENVLNDELASLDMQKKYVEDIHFDLGVVCTAVVVYSDCGPAF